MALEDKHNVAHGLLKELSNSLFPIQQKLTLPHHKFSLLTAQFSHTQNFHKYTRTSPDGKTHNQIDNILIERWHSSTPDVRSFSGADCDTDHCLVVAEFRERLAVSKQVAQRFDVERLNLRKLNELKVRKQYQIEITNRFGALVN